jgi:hypothetical protein
MASSAGQTNFNKIKACTETGLSTIYDCNRNYIEDPSLLEKHHFNLTDKKLRGKRKTICPLPLLLLFLIYIIT